MPTNPPNTNGTPPPPCGGGQIHAPRESGGGASSNPDHPQSDPTPTPPLLSLPTPALTPDESQILEYLLHPDADPAAVAAAYSLTLTDLALWLRQPHIQQAQDALRQLHTLQRRAWQDQVTKEAVETLRNVMHAAEDPVERRRAAAAILRALTRTNRTPRRPSNNPTNQPTLHTDSPPQSNTPQHQTPTDTYPSAAAAAATPDTPNTTPHTKPSTKPAPDDWDHPDHWCNSPAFQAVYRTLDECRARAAAKDNAQAKPEAKAETDSKAEGETEAETNPNPHPTDPDSS